MVYIRVTGLKGSDSHLFNNFSSSVYGAVIDHIHDGYPQVTTDSKRDAESQSTHDGNDVPPGEPKAGTVAHWGFLHGRLQGFPIFCEFDVVPRLLFLL